MLSWTRRNTATLVLVGAYALPALSGCDNSTSGGTGARHTVENRTTVGNSTVVEASSDSSRVLGTVSAPAITAQSDRYRLVQRSLRPEMNPQ